MSKASKWALVILAVLLLIFARGSARLWASDSIPSAPQPSETPILPTQAANSSPLPPTPMPALVTAEVLSPTPVPVTVEVPSPTSTPALVTVTAVGGDLAIRSGPDTVFSAIAVLHNGETADALARSVLDGWVQIPIPSQAGRTGWVSIQTKYAVVSGYVLDLPMIRKVEWPTGAYLINCTAHQMRAEPGGTLIPPISDAPNNRVWFPPSPYQIYDTEVAGQPFVMNVYLGAHSEVRIQIDGNRQRSYCPK